MSFAEVDLFGVYVAPISVMMVAAWLVLIALRRVGDHFGLLRRVWHAIPLPVLIGVNAVRVLGIVMVLWHEAGRLSAPFAPIAGWGDVLIGLTAIPVALAVRAAAPGWRPAALLWNALGLLDLVAAIALGLTSAEGTPLRIFFGEPGTGLMGELPLVLIPAYLVPLLIVTHLAVFARLRARLSP